MTKKGRTARLGDDNIQMFFSSYKNNYSIGDLVLFSIVCINVHCKYDLYCMIPDVIS